MRGESRATPKTARTAKHRAQARELAEREGVLKGDTDKSRNDET